MLRILYFTGFLSLSLVNPIFAKGWDYKFGLGLKALSIDSDKLRARVWSVNPIVSSEFKLGVLTSFNFDFGAILETGSNRSLLIDEYSPQKSFYIKTAHFKFNFFKSFNIQAGAINQDIYDSPIFLSNLAFVGLRQNFQYSFGAFHIKLITSQSIPNNDTLTSRLSTVEEGTPLFYTETIQFKYKSGVFKSSLAYTHFNFKNISQNVAFESRYLGNTTTGTQASNAAFLYEYQGHNSLLNLSLNYPSFYTAIKAQFLHNNFAPNSRADGLYLSFALGWPAFYMIVEKYDVESDATIAYYNSGDYGHTNRAGHALGFVYKAKAMKTSVLYHNQDVILDTGLYQAKRDVVTLDFTVKL